MLDNTALIESSNHWFALVALVGGVMALLWAIDIVLFKFGLMRIKRPSLELVARYAFPLGFFVSLFAMLGSLYYSYYLGIAACELCWFARVFIYPQVFLFGLAWYKNDHRIFDYVLMLSGVGAFIGVYHHYLQMGYDLYKPCAAIPFAADCSVPTFIEYGFVTYPLMGVVTCAILFLAAYSAKKFVR